MAAERKVWRYQRGNQKTGDRQYNGEKRKRKKENNGQQKIENTDI
jgi:hypothetical protein